LTSPKNNPENPPKNKNVFFLFHIKIRQGFNIKHRDDVFVVNPLSIPTTYSQSILGLKFSGFDIPPPQDPLELTFKLAQMIDI
jgi:hypothetical protein